MTIHSGAYQRYQRSKILRPYLSGTNEDLFLKQVVTGEAPDMDTFEVPVKYDLLQHSEFLRLVVDPRDEEDVSGILNVFQDCKRATNGNCLLAWNITFDPPGQHRLRASLFCPGPRMSKHWEFLGPTLPFNSSNIFQFDPFYAEFDDSGAILYAKVAMTNMAYSIEVTTPAGAHIKTITGSTSNGIIEAHWDLIDEHGNKYTNDFDSAFHVVLPDGTTETNSTPEIHSRKLP